MTPSSETFSLTTILAVALLLAAGRLGRSTSIRRFAQLDSLAGKAIREPEFRHLSESPWVSWRLPRHCRVTSRRGDLQHIADRLDPEPVPVFVDEAHYFGSRGSSSLAKKADAALRIWLARRSSRTSFSNSAIRCWSLVVTPGR